MTSARMLAAIAASALACSAPLTVAMAQQPPDLPAGRLYIFHSRPHDGCPSLDWHVVLGSDNSLSGLIATNDMSRVFRISGTLKPDRTFHLTGKEVGGAERTGTVDGQVRHDGWMVADISNVSGPSPCNNHTVTVQWWDYDYHQG
jgi:hypothetical protein